MSDPSTAQPTAVSFCEGCHSLQEGVQLFEILLVGLWERVYYCPECADLARMNWNGVTDDLREVEN